MANERGYLENIILDWENELKYRQDILNSASSTKEEKELARERIAFAKSCLKAAKADLAKLKK